MKKLLIILVCLFLGGCFFPYFHDKVQTIHFKNPSNLLLTIENKRDILEKITVNRSFFNIKGTLSKKGFEDKEIEIKNRPIGRILFLLFLGVFQCRT